jgi:hypothetical protein
VFPDDEPGLEQPCASRRGRIIEIDRAFLHFCVRCGAFAIRFWCQFANRPSRAVVLCKT